MTVARLGMALSLLLLGCGIATAAGISVSETKLYQRQAHRIWVARVPEGTDLDATLAALAGELHPGQSDMVVVGNTRGVRARVPALAGRTDLIDAAFAASRAELAADLDTGMVAFSDRLVMTLDGQVVQARFFVGAFLLCLLVTAAVVTDRFRFFWRLKQRWAFADRRSRQELIDLVQIQLQTIAHRNISGGRVLYDEAYARLERLRDEPFEKAQPELVQLHRELEAWLAANPGGDPK